MKGILQGWANEIKLGAKNVEERSAAEPMAIHAIPTPAHHFQYYLLLQYLFTEIALSHILCV